VEGPRAIVKSLLKGREPLPNKPKLSEKDLNLVVQDYYHHLAEISRYRTAHDTWFSRELGRLRQGLPKKLRIQSIGPLTPEKIRVASFQNPKLGRLMINRSNYVVTHLLDLAGITDPGKRQLVLYASNNLVGEQSVPDIERKSYIDHLLDELPNQLTDSQVNRLRYAHKDWLRARGNVPVEWPRR
jgi:hypothetical protein